MEEKHTERDREREREVQREREREQKKPAAASWWRSFSGGSEQKEKDRRPTPHAIVEAETSIEPLDSEDLSARESAREAKDRDETRIPGWEQTTLPGTCIQTLQTADTGNVVYCLQWDPTTGRVATGTRRLAVQLWDLGTGQLVQTLMGHTKEVGCLYFDDNKIVSGSGDHTIKVWDAKSGRCEMTCAGHANSVMSLMFDDTYKMVSGSYDKTIKVWDMRVDGKLLSTYEGHSSAVFCLKFDCDKIISGSADCTLRVWDFAKTQYL